MKKSLFTRCALLYLLIVILSSCMEQDVFKGGKNQPLSSTDVFDFKLEKQIRLNIDYGFSNNYYVIFDLYDQNPLIEKNNSLVKDETIASLYSNFTDTKGKFSGTASIPSDLKELWLYSDYSGVISPVKLTITDDEIKFDQQAYIASMQAQTRAGTTSNNYKYIDDIIPGTSWDVYGLPSNVEKELSMPPAEILYSINSVYSGAKDDQISVRHPEWLTENKSSEIKITKETEISLVYINSGASWNNTVGYFTYPTGTVPQEATIKKIIAFPNISSISKTNKEGRVGAMICGHEVKLKYWNEKKQEFEDKFPSGVSIGWYLNGNSFDKGTINKRNYAPTRYSYSTLNTQDNKPRIIALRDSQTDQIVSIGFEDNDDYNYTDATFYVKIAESGAISSDLPELPPVDPPTNAKTTVKGTLIFEDQWPAQFDYDMNDVIVEYSCTRYKNVVSNKIYKIVDEFTPTHSGGSNICGFGYQLNKFDPSRIKKIEVSGSANWEQETGQTFATIILTDNIKQALNTKITVTIELTDVEEEEIKAPYNPFIFSTDRSREIHLVNYPPTSKANLELFNTKNDMSNIAEGVYYITNYNNEIKQMPFAINLPIHNFKVPAEKVKIYESFPGFINWVNSKGATNKDWYKHPAF